MTAKIRLVFDDEFLADPHLHNAKLREAAPSHRVALPDGSAARLLCPYEPVRAGLADAELSLDKKRSRGGYAGFSLPPALDANLLNMDPPQHTRIRRLVTKAFTVRRVQALRPRVADHAESLADKLISPSDLVAEYAAPIPSVALGALLGVSSADQDEFAELIGRFALSDGEHWEAGETVMLSLAAANRDPARFPDSDRFAIRRTDNAHVTFGHGVHHCVGAALARMEVEVAISVLLRRFPELSLAVPVEDLRWRTSFRSRAISALPVHLG